MDLELLLEILTYASGPIVGAIIGIFTNYIAVKMLFRPYLPKRIFGLALPFTPGIIPKRRGALASAIGKAVGEELFTGDDIKNMLLSSEMESLVADALTRSVQDALGKSCDELALAVTDNEGASALKDKLSLFLAQRLTSALIGMDIAQIIASQGKEAILEKRASLGLLGAFLTDGVIDPLLDEVKVKISTFIDENGAHLALNAIRAEVQGVCACPVGELFDASKIDLSALSRLIMPIYEDTIVKAIGSATQSLDICAIVERKINQMDIRELEALCLRVMKRELNAVIYLGGVIGLILGTINIFI